MALQGVPWAIGSGAQTPVEAARLLAHIASGGHEGVGGPGDMLVQPLEVPGAGVRVMPGAAVLTNRFPGGGQQAYLVRNDAATNVAITATGSGSGRTDLVAVIVEDPQYAGQPAPASVENGPYVRFAVYTDVAPTTTTLAEVDPGQTGLALALVTLGASDGTVELASITNLLEQAQPRVGGLTRTVNKPNGAVAEVLTSAAYSRFPDQASWSITIPDWAVKCSLEMYAGGVRLVDDATDGGTWRGTVRVALDADADGMIATAGAEVNEVSIGPSRTSTITYMAAQDLAIPKAMRGKVATFRAEGQRLEVTGGLELRATNGTTVVLKVTFYEDVDESFWIA